MRKGKRKDKRKDKMEMVMKNHIPATFPLSRFSLFPLFPSKTI